jgi:chromate transporter
MIFLKIFIAFFIPGIVGYGGGPATIPLIEHEVVDRYGWMTTSEFSEVFAIGNTLPGPIATKMAGYIGYEVGGVLGAIIAVLARIGPSLFLMIVLLQLIYRYKDSPKVKRLSKIVLPAIAVLMGTLTFDFFQTSYNENGFWSTFLIALVSLLLMEKWKIHPAFVIAGGLVVGALFLS